MTGKPKKAGKSQAGSVRRKQTSRSAAIGKSREANKAAKVSALTGLRKDEIRTSVKDKSGKIEVRTNSSSPALRYGGRITTSGTSDAIRIEKAFFKHHPEFSQQSAVTVYVIGEGQMLVSVEAAATSSECDEDPILDAFLAFLAKDMKDRPENISLIDQAVIARAKEITEGVVFSDEDFE